MKLLDFAFISSPLYALYGDRFYRTDDRSITHDRPAKCESKEQMPLTNAHKRLFGESHRELREFSVKGHTIMAYSLKDAITRLKHQKKI